MKLTRFYLIAKNLPGTHVFTVLTTVRTCMYTILLPNPGKNILSTQSLDT